MRPRSADIAAWANRLDSRSALPELVRRLIHATVADLDEIDFSAGDEIQRHGVDGRVRSRSVHVFVPQGPSVWELGTSMKVQAKADDDYRKRTDKPPDGIEPSLTTYVFVTPRRWTGRAEWAAARAEEKIWADVRAFDADSLEQWLELAPSASAW